jgi:hypothetical protein
MVDQYYLWRTGRAVSMSLVIVFFEFLFVKGWLPKPVPVEEIAHPWYYYDAISGSLGSLLLLTLNTLSFMITKQIYSRLCFTLFALVYVTQDKRNVELQKTA